MANPHFIEIVSTFFKSVFAGSQTDEWKRLWGIHMEDGSGCSTGKTSDTT